MRKTPRSNFVIEKSVLSFAETPQSTISPCPTRVFIVDIILDNPLESMKSIRERSTMICVDPRVMISTISDLNLGAAAASNLGPSGHTIVVPFTCSTVIPMPFSPGV